MLKSQDHTTIETKLIDSFSVWSRDSTFGPDLKARMLVSALIWRPQCRSQRWFEDIAIVAKASSQVEQSKRSTAVYIVLILVAERLSAATTVVSCFTRRLLLSSFGSAAARL